MPSRHRRCCRRLGQWTKRRIRKEGLAHQLLQTTRILTAWALRHSRRGPEARRPGVTSGGAAQAGTPTGGCGKCLAASCCPQGWQGRNRGAPPAPRAPASPGCPPRAAELWTYILTPFMRKLCPPPAPSPTLPPATILQTALPVSVDGQDGAGLGRTATVVAQDVQPDDPGAPVASGVYCCTDIGRKGMCAAGGMRARRTSTGGRSQARVAAARARGSRREARLGPARTIRATGGSPAACCSRSTGQEAALRAGGPPGHTGEIPSRPAAVDSDPIGRHDGAKSNRSRESPARREGPARPAPAKQARPAGRDDAARRSGVRRGSGGDGWAGGRGFTSSTCRWPASCPGIRRR